MRAHAVISIGALLTLASCGDANRSGDSSPDVDDIVADLEKAGLCDNPRVPEEDSEDASIDLGFEPPEQQIECDGPAEDSVVNVSKTKSDAAIRALAVVAMGFYDAFGIDGEQVEVLVLGDGVLATLDTAEEFNDDPDYSVANKWAADAQDVVGGEVKSMAELAKG